MPSNLFFGWMHALVARCTQPMGKMFFFLRSALFTTGKLA